MERKEQAGKRQFQSASETLEDRANKKLLENVTWFRGKGKKSKMEDKQVLVLPSNEEENEWEGRSEDQQQ